MLKPASRLPFAAFIMALPLLSACSINQMVLKQVADQLAHSGASDDPDLLLVRDAAPFHLKLSETLLKPQPQHLPLAESVAAGFTQYAYAFVAFEADLIEAKDSKTAETLRARAAKLYLRGRNHVLAALTHQYPTLKTALEKNQPLPPLDPAHVGAVYWAAASWGGWISLSKDDPDAVASLPDVVRLATWAWNAAPAWGEGSLSSLMGTLEASRPGGSLKKAEHYFGQAIEQSQGLAAGPWLAKAENIALPQQDRTNFELWIKQALNVAERTAATRQTENAVMARRARWLLEQSPDLF